MGTVREAIRKQHSTRCQKVAIKSIPKKSIFSISKLKTEIKILLTADHPNIVKLFEVYEDSQYIHLVMEMCKGKSLMEVLSGNAMSEKHSINFMFQICNAVSYLHSLNFVHRDLKPSNFILTSSDSDAQVKIIDFGLSTKFKDNKNLDSTVGTPYYMAPEILISEYGNECDVWSLGVSLYEIISGIRPFYGGTVDDIFKQILNVKVKFKGEAWEGVSGECKDLIKKMLVKDRTHRISIQGVLQHTVFDVIKDQLIALVPMSVVESALSFTAKSKISQSIIKIIIKHLISEIPHQLIQSFQTFDIKHSGKVNLQDIIPLVESNYNTSYIKKLKSILPRPEAQNSLILTFSDFIFSYLNSESLTEELLKDVYYHITNVKSIQDNSSSNITYIRNSLNSTGINFDIVDFDNYFFPERNCMQEVDFASFKSILNKNLNIR